ncbi:MAG TPA: hypothetical protein VGY50_05325, partial [Streptosporangiaceae bacterium]|nr:hypothetical protein [Streptosporangiaceae bacterium]
MSESANGQAKVPGQDGAAGHNGSAPGATPPSGAVNSGANGGAANGATSGDASRGARLPGPHYKWLALSNTTMGMLAATVNASIVIISLPAIFRGVKLNPLTPGNVSYLLWMLMGYLVV